MTPRIPLTLAALALTAACSTTTATTTGSTPDTGDARHRTTTTVPTPEPGTTVAPGQLPPGDPSFPMPGPNTCHVGQRNGQPIPDPTCTPGAINPAVTQATIGQTICVKGWTATVRPPVSVTDEWKPKLAAAYGIAPVGEEDHFEPLELGGAPLDTRNLWVQPGRIPNAKDPVENYLKREVCAGRMTLAAAQAGIASDWTQYLAQAGGSPATAEEG